MDDQQFPLLPQPGSAARYLALMLLVVAPLLIGLLGLHLGPDANWDLRNYHWYNAYALVNGRFGFDLLPSQLPSFYNPALDVPFFFLASSLPAQLAGFILASVQGLNFILLFMLAHAALIIPRPLQKVLVCTLLAAMGVLGASGIAQIGTTFYDNITSLGVFLSALLTLRSYPLLLRASWPKALALAILCGFPAGVMMGLKLPSVVFCIGLCGALLFVSGSLQRRVGIAFGFGIGVLLGLALSLGPWAWSLYQQFGNPLFPYFNTIFQSPFAPLSSARDLTFIPQNWHDRLFFPFIFSQNPYSVGEIPWRDLRLPLLYCLLPIGLVLHLVSHLTHNKTDPITTPLPTRYLLWAATLSYAVWLFLFAIYRYILSLEMLAPLLIVMALGMLPWQVRTRAVFAAVVLAAIVVTIQPGTWRRKPHWQDHTVSVQGPDLKASGDLMILMAGYEPYSHVLSEFPPHIPFIRIQSNFTGPETNTEMNTLIKQRVTNHKGSFKLLIPQHHLLLGKAALQSFDLTLAPDSCQAVRDNLSDFRLALCDVQPTHKLAILP
jgi:hypothetical protein